MRQTGVTLSGNFLHSWFELTWAVLKVTWQLLHKYGLPLHLDELLCLVKPLEGGQTVFLNLTVALTNANIVYCSRKWCSSKHSFYAKHLTPVPTIKEASHAAFMHQNFVYCAVLF